MLKIFSILVSASASNANWPARPAPEFIGTLRADDSICRGHVHDDGMNTISASALYTMKVFYHREQVASNAAAYSPSAYKPKQVIDDWLAHGIIHSGDICNFEPVIPW